MARRLQPLTRGILAVAACVALSTWGCSGQQQSEEELESTDEQEAPNNAAQENVGEGNGQGNYTDGAEANNGTAEDNADTQNDTAEESPTLDGGSSAEAPPLNSAPSNIAADPTAGLPTAAPALPAAPAPEGSAPVPGGRVRYVKEGGAQVMNAPNGQPVGNLEQGEHPVTWEENGWFRVSNGWYIPKDAMSEKGVPRPGQARPGSLAH